LPYVSRAEWPDLTPDIADYEPRAALDGGPDGLDVVRRLLDRLPDVLAEDGVALLEIGADHGTAIAAEVAARLPGWRCTVTADLSGRPRLARVERPADAR
jgi:release factor glutamine methyltransferase